MRLIVESSNTDASGFPGLSNTNGRLGRHQPEMSVFDGRGMRLTILHIVPLRSAKI